MGYSFKNIAWWMGPAIGSTPYYQQAQALLGSSIIRYLPLWDAVGAAAAEDISTSGTDGTPSNVTFGATGIGDGRTAANFGGTNSRINIYSASFNTAWDGDEFGIVLWLKLAAATWLDGANRVALRIWVNANNYIQIWKPTTNSTFYLEHKSGGGTLNRVTLSVSYTDWFPVGITGSLSGNKVHFYLNGHREGVEATGQSAWAGALSSTNCNLGVADNTNVFPFSGFLAHCIITDRLITKLEMKTLAWNKYKPYAAFFGDSVTAGTGATTEAQRWVNLVAASKGWDRFLNAGIGGTPLQNTVQNTVAVIGGAVTNNGRDTYTTRVAAYNPDYVYILYGLNDLRLNDAAFTADLFETDLGEVVDGLVSSGVAASNIIIGSPPYMTNYAAGAPWNAGSTVKHVAYVAKCAAVAAAKGTRYIDVYQWMIDNGGASLISVDGIHPNDAGHAAIANAFLSVL